MGFLISQPIDRISVNSALIVACFVSVLLLTSQSAASYPSYILAVSMLAFARSWNDVFSIRLAWLIIGLVTYLCLSSLWSQPLDVDKTRSITLRGLLVLLFVASLAECQIRGVVQRWLGRAFAIVGGLVVSLALIYYFVNQPADGRLNGLGQLDTHVVAALVHGVVLIFMLEILFTERSIWWRVFAGVGAALLVAAVILSDSRNAWVSVLVGVFVFIFSHRAKDPRQFAIGVAVLGFVLATAIAVLLVDEQTRDLVLPRGDSFRLVIWQSTIERILDGHMLFGLGVASSDDVQVGGIVFEHPHNMYLAILFQGGLVALALFLSVIFASAKVLLENYTKRDAKLAIGILALALSAFLLDGHELVDKVGEAWFLFWLPVSLALGLRWSQPRR